MATNKRELQIIVTAKNEAEKQLSRLKSKVKDLGPTFKKMSVAGTVATGSIVFGMKEAIKASNSMENALIGLSTVAGAFKEDVNDARQAAVDLAADGLLSVNEAAEGLKNLLPRLGLERSIELMNGFKDTAAFNRQGTLGFGQAIVGATQGIKNMNSIMVDNAGITKNLSIILKEQGFEMQDLDDKTLGVAASNALYNGLLKEMEIFSGDAAKASETLAGKQAKLSVQIFNTKAAIGKALAPALAQLLTVITPIIEKVGIWIEKNPALTKNILLLVGGLTALVAVLGTLAIVLPPIIAGFGLLFSPITLIIGLITALTLTTIKLVKEWEESKESMKFVWEVIKELFRDGTDFIIKKLQPVFNAIDKLKKAGGTIKTSFKNLPANLGFDGARANGGPVQKGKSFLVGEKGPELFAPSSNGNIVPNNKLGGGGGINVTVNGDVSGEELIEKIESALMGKLRSEQRIPL